MSSQRKRRKTFGGFGEHACMHLYVVREDNNLTCRGAPPAAHTPFPTSSPLNISFRMSHMPSERTRYGDDDDGDAGAGEDAFM